MRFGIVRRLGWTASAARIRQLRHGKCVRRPNGRRRFHAGDILEIESADLAPELRLDAIAGVNYDDTTWQIRLTSPFDLNLDHELNRGAESWDLVTIQRTFGHSPSAPAVSTQYARDAPEFTPLKRSVQRRLPHVQNA